MTENIWNKIPEVSKKQTLNLLCIIDYLHIVYIVLRYDK